MNEIFKTIRNRTPFLLAVILISGCISSSPGEQCLDSFRETLKDPDSGKLVSFAEPNLKYSATNSYGARTQGNAICTKVENKWERDTSAEYMTILKEMADRLEKSNDCRKRGGSRETCAGNSIALKYGSYNEADLQNEVRRDLGF